MATFSQSEAEACKVVRCESVQSDAVHQYYVFAATDNNGEYYEWTDNVLASGASQADLKGAMTAELQCCEKRVPGPVILHVPDGSGVIGATISSL